jgi:FixJ family two-component response regulator
MKLAIVDDDEDVRRALVRLLRGFGHDVRAFGSAEEFEAAPVMADCLILDVRLPGMSGYELSERLHQRPVRLPIVLITGDSYVKADVSASTRTPLITKPFDDATLLAAVAQAMASTAVEHARHAR